MTTTFTRLEQQQIEREARRILLRKAATRRARELELAMPPSQTYLVESVLVADEDPVDHSGEAPDSGSDPLIDRPGPSVFDEILKITDDLRQRIATGCNCTCVH